MSVAELHLTPQVVFGDGALDRVGPAAAAFGRRALLVTDQGLVRAGLAAAVRDRLAAAAVESVVFDRVDQNPTIENVEQGLRAGDGEGIELVVSVGGGSVHDCAKTVAIVAACGGHVRDYEGMGRAAADGFPVVAVNTTAGSGAEVSRFAVVSDGERRVKMVLADARLVPRVAVEDPRTTLGLPGALTASSGLDALTHAVEAAVSTEATPFSDLFAFEAITLAGAWLERAVADGSDLDAREGMLRASLLAAFAFNAALVGAAHALAHPLGAVYDLPHGVCNGILLPVVARANLDAAPERYERVAAALGVADGRRGRAAGERVVAELRRIADAVGAPAGLRALGVDESAIPELAAKAIADVCMSTNPRPLTAGEVEALYREALDR